MCGPLSRSYFYKIPNLKNILEYSIIQNLFNMIETDLHLMKKKFIKKQRNRLSGITNKIAVTTTGKKVLVKQRKPIKKVITYETIKNTLNIRTDWYKRIYADHQLKMLSKNPIHKTKLKKRSVEHVKKQIIKKKAKKVKKVKPIIDLEYDSADDDQEHYLHHLQQEAKRVERLLKIENIIKIKKDKKQKLTEELIHDNSTDSDNSDMAEHDICNSCDELPKKQVRKVIKVKKKQNDGEDMKHCNDCNKSVQSKNFKRHMRSQSHKRKASL